MTPGSTTWIDVVPTILVAAALLFVPGTVAALLIRVPWQTALGIGPALGTTVLVTGGVVCAALGLSWGVLTVVLTTAAGWVAAALIGLAVARWSRKKENPPGGPDVSRPGWAGPRRRTALLGPVVTIGSLALTLAAVGAVLLNVSGTPDHFPQHPDTIFHLGDATWMVQQRDVSVLHAYHFMATGRSGLYPAAFHVITSTTAMLTGANVVVATQCAVLVMGGLVWPAGLMLLGQSVMGRRPEVLVASAVSSVLFTAFPFTLMGYGVLWPNLFGQALLPGVLAVTWAAVARFAPHRAPSAAPLAGAVLTLVAVPGLTLVHPNALIALLIFTYAVLATATVRSAWEVRARPLGVAARVLGLVLVTAGAAAGSVAMRSPSMEAAGARGPEKGLLGALADTIFFGPRQGQALVLLTVVAVVGAVGLLTRHRGAGWVPVSAALIAGTYLLAVTVDNDQVRYLTWPWYNTTIRLAVLGSLPSALCAAAGFVAIGTLVAKGARGIPAARVVATGLVLAAFLVLTQGYVGEHRAFLHRYYHPSAANSWASDDELRALRQLSRDIPDGAVTAANAWNGGTYLYIVSGKPLMVPTEKALFAGDRTLLAARLDEVGTSPEVCAAARREGVEYALTGGQPFAWAGARRVALYAGIDGVGSSPAFTKVATAAPYTLWRLTTCAGS